MISVNYSGIYWYVIKNETADCSNADDNVYESTFPYRGSNSHKGHTHTELKIC